MAERTPAEDGFHMPAEWAPHDRCWMGWPCRESLWGDDLEAARDAYAAVARAIAGFEPVTMLVNEAQLADARTRCGDAVTCQALPLDDSWLRDTGPTFVVNGRGGIAGVDWRFNAWGEKFLPWDQDALIAERLLARLGVPRYAAPLVLEGGSIHVDGEGTLLTSEECLLNPNRNPDLDRAAIEALLRRYLGVEAFVWLGQGLDKDDTDGHVDNIACFVAPGVVMAVTCDDPADPNHAILADNLARLRKAKDARGRSLEIVELPLPREPRHVDGPGGSQRLALSYVNYYIANGGIV
ncbi:MAG: agmatine deiminase family protein, partial [Bacteroidota bacterium]